MEFAEGSFLQIVVSGRARIVTGRLEHVSVVRGDPDLIQGAITLGEIRSVTPGESFPARLSVEFAQYAGQEARIKSGGQGWNGVETTSGVYLILALAELQAPATALAVRQIKSPNDPFAREVAWCVDAERHQAPAGRLALIRDALLNGHGLIAAWGHYCAGRLKRIPRADAVSLELGLLNNKTRDEHDRSAAAQNLELELWKGGDPDDALNQQIASAFLSNLASASRALRTYLIEALHRLVFASAPPGEQGEAFRRKLRYAISITSEPDVVQTLNSERGDTSVGRAAEELLGWVQK